MPWYEADYTSADYFDGLFEQNAGLISGMMNGIKIATIAAALISVICGMAGMRLEPKKKSSDSGSAIL